MNSTHVYVCPKPGCNKACTVATSTSDKNKNRQYWSCPEHRFAGWVAPGATSATQAPSAFPQSPFAPPAAAVSSSSSLSAGPDDQRMKALEQRVMELENKVQSIWQHLEQQLQTQPPQFRFAPQ